MSVIGIAAGLGAVGFSGAAGLGEWVKRADFAKIKKELLKANEISSTKEITYREILKIASNEKSNAYSVYTTFKKTVARTNTFIIGAAISLAVLIWPTIKDGLAKLGFKAFQD